MTFTTRTAMLRAVMLGASALTMTAVTAMPAAAQTVTATIRGQVMDGKGAGVPNAVVTAVNEGTSCGVNDRCITGGHCQQGACVGEAISCDDGNPYEIDHMQSREESNPTQQAEHSGVE